jgi:hypothetical protein
VRWLQLLTCWIQINWQGNHIEEAFVKSERILRRSCLSHKTRSVKL